jgi:hypothetical protein
MRRAIAVFLDALLIFWAMAIGPLCWLLRDGLGPAAVDSRGADAVVRFLLTFYWGPALVVIAALRLLVRRRRPSAQAAIADASP